MLPWLIPINSIVGVYINTLWKDLVEDRVEIIIILASYLIFIFPLTTVVVLGTVSLLASYLMGRNKYKDTISVREFIGSVLIVIAVIIFAIQS